MSNTVSDIAAQMMDTQEKQSAQYTGNVWLKVKVDSYWSDTPENSGRKRLNQTYRTAKLHILKFPYQDLGAQKPEIVAHLGVASGHTLRHGLLLMQES